MATFVDYCESESYYQQTHNIINDKVRLHCKRQALLLLTQEFGVCDNKMYDVYDFVRYSIMAHDKIRDDRHTIKQRLKK